MIRKAYFVITAAALLASIFIVFVASAGEAPPAASQNGKYSGLVQVMNCPKDAATYGTFRDYGWWGGGPWCGQTGKPGYWVWVAPDWYVWSNKGQLPSSSVPASANVGGKYSNLIQTLPCPKDRTSYGEFRDYGWWGGGAWCGRTGKAGYWVWVAPNWYIWANQN